ncbi:MAG: tRNA (adenosine(37)-N6)-dimethylallyltransferase MiaA [Patescibacteria group bacterium]|nr:tRNA (adenosine(37)-N6)-dimethylallyltransferase MiaA [Patescibacteria group bacterium]
MKEHPAKEPLAVLAIVGPTASGKSDLAVAVAREVGRRKLGGYSGAEIVSADSRQVYRGLDIGTGKVTRSEMRGIRHHLLDVADPRRAFTAEKYRRLALKAIAGIAARGNLPIVCGGTGFYIDALFSDGLPAAAPDPKLRARLSGKPPEELLALLKRADRARWETISANPSDCKNPRRIIRAIEVASAGKRTTRPPHERSDGQTYSVSYIGIRLPKEALAQRIHDRLAARLRRGMVAEVRRLHEHGLSWKRMDELGLEYRYLSRYLRGLTMKGAMAATLETGIRRYAKRQMTWFMRDPRITWLSRAATGRDLTKLIKSTIILPNRRDHLL